MPLNYHFVGNPAGCRLIVFLHEGLGSVAQWKNFPEKLCALTNSYGFVYDRPGYGKSPGNLSARTVNYLHEAAHQLDEMLEKHVTSALPLILYGHSDGGSIALIYAGLNPQKVSGIIVEAAHVFVENETLAGVQQAREDFIQKKFDGLKKYHGQRYKEVFWAWNNIWLNSAFSQWNIVSLVQNITCPQLIIQGKNDGYATLNQVETIAAFSKGASTLLIPENCGHAPHKEKEEQVLAALQKFLNGN